MNCIRFLFVLLQLRSPPTLDIENGKLLRPLGIIHVFPDTSLASAKFARIQAAPYRALEGHLNEASVIASHIHLFTGCAGSPHAAWAQVKAAAPISGV